MSLSEFPPLPKSTHSRKRSTSDPACLTSTTSINSSKEVKSFEKTLATLDAIEKAKAQAGRPKAARKDSGIGISNGIASLDGAVNQQSGVPSDSKHAAGRRSAVTEKTAVNGSAQKASSSPKSNRSVLEASKDISKLSPKELKALSDTSVPHVKLAVIDPSLPSTRQERTVIHDSYPLPLLCAISPRIAIVLASRTTPDTSRKASTISANSTDSTLIATSSHSNSNATPPTGLVLHTTSPTPLGLILTYALTASRHGSLIHPTAYSLLSISLADCAFFKYGKIVEEARYLGFTYLENTLLKRMRKIAAGQVHSADVERILASPVTNNPPSSWIVDLAVTSVAAAYWEERLQYKYKYDALCEKYPAFEREIEEAIEALDEQYAY